MLLWLNPDQSPPRVGSIPGMNPAWNSVQFTRSLERIQVNCGPLLLAAVIKLARATPTGAPAVEPHKSLDV
jgi:hypothetical protein